MTDGSGSGARLKRLFVLAVLLPALVALGIATWSAHRRERADLEQGLLYTVRALSGALDREILGSQAALQALAVADELDRGDFPAFGRHARQVLEATGIGEEVTLIDPGGRPILDTAGEPGLVPLRPTDPERIRQIFSSGRPYVTDVIEDAPRRVLILVDVPVSRGGRVLYDLGLVLRNNRLQLLLDAQNVPGDWDGGVIDRYGVIIARFHDAGNSGGRKNSPSVLKSVAERDEGVAEMSTPEGASFIAAFRRSDITGFVTGIGMPTDSLTTQLWEAAAPAAFGLAVLLLASAALGWAVGGPLQRAGRQPDAAAATQSGRPVPPVGRTEAVQAAEQRLRLTCAGRHLLLAEDDPINCEVTLHFLRRVGLQVDVTQDGRQALDLAARNRYDLILMDVQMPQLDGVEASRAIRQLPDRGDVPIVALTADAFPENRQRCMQAGMNDFLAKPVQAEEFYSTLLRWLSAPRTS